MDRETLSEVLTKTVMTAVLCWTRGVISVEHSGS